MKFIKLTNEDGRKMNLSVNSIMEIQEGCITDDDKNTMNLNRIAGNKFPLKNKGALFTKIVTIIGKKYFVKESEEEILKKVGKQR